jgi:IclR family acetate operon transcriptional repressor
MSPRYPLASVDRALQILEMLRTEPALRLSDVARRLGVANSTAHRLLAALAHRGLVEQEPSSRRYTSGPTLIAIGRAALLHGELATRARPALERLAHELGETIHLGVREGATVRYLDAVESTRLIRVSARTGSTMPAHWTSTGKALLSGLSDGAVGDLYRTDELPTGTPNSIGSLGELLADLDRCRRSGFAVSDGESEEDLVSVAVPLADASGDVVAAVSCAAPVTRLRPSKAPEVAVHIRAFLTRNPVAGIVPAQPAPTSTVAVGS